LCARLRSLYPSFPSPSLLPPSRFDFDSGLAPYNLGSFNRWRSLSAHVTRDTIEALRPLALSGNITVEAEEEDDWRPRVRGFFALLLFSCVLILD
jgi:hypothetical protein